MPTPSDLQQRCCNEIAELHDFFERWFSGELPATDDAFGRFESVLAPSFGMVSPDGRPMSRQEVLDMVRAGHGGTGDDEGDTMRIETRGHRIVTTVGEAVLVAYEEWQIRGGTSRARLSTALFQPNPDCPNGLEWLHVHETWC